MSTKNLTISILVLALVVVGLVLLTNYYPSQPKENQNNQLIVEEPAGKLTEENWTSPDNPRFSTPLEKNDIPFGAVKITISEENGFSPDTFQVKKGEKITIVLTSQGGGHIFKFRDKALKDVIISLYSGETRGIAFYAPEKAGEYEFYCDMPGHYGINNEKGLMKVK